MNKFGSFNIKVALLAAGVLIAIVILYFTQILVTRIQLREAQIAQLYAKSLEYIANDESSTGEYGFIFNEIITQIDFPIIATDRDYSTVSFYKNIDIDTLTAPEEINKELLNLAKELREVNPPIKVAYRDSIILNWVHYGESSLITELRLLPLFEIIIGAIFILIGYVGFSYIKKHEQSSIWVGLSKETAHQLGTPLSSLMGWLEILRNAKSGTEEYERVLRETESDLDKLKKIASRFSKIGSQSKLENENLCELINSVCNYFRKRIPSLAGKDGTVTRKITISADCPEGLSARINRELFEWVLENLLKNAIDAIDKDTGEIGISVSEKDREIIIDVTDNGKGIDKKFRKDIFRPGFSTKRRGWGLGLSLSKRIIDEYHTGKLTLHSSIMETGTTFRIRLGKWK